MTARALTYLKWGFFLLFVNINVGRWDLLPGFLGSFLLLKALRNQEMTETERRICPLLIVLTLDRFLHWGWDFQNGLESLIVAVLDIYTTYILLGEISLRVKEEQPERAENLQYIRIAFTVLAVLGYLVAAYEQETIIFLIACGMLLLYINLFWVLCKIIPIDSGENGL